MTKEFITRVAQDGTIEDLKGLRGFTKEVDFLEKTILQLEKMILRDWEERAHPIYNKYNSFYIVK